MFFTIGGGKVEYADIVRFCETLTIIPINCIIYTRNRTFLVVIFHHTDLKMKIILSILVSLFAFATTTSAGINKLQPTGESTPDGLPIMKVVQSGNSAEVGKKVVVDAESSVTFPYNPDLDNTTPFEGKLMNPLKEQVTFSDLFKGTRQISIIIIGILILGIFVVWYKFEHSSKKE